MNALFWLLSTDPDELRYLFETVEYEEGQAALYRDWAAQQ